MRFKGFISVCLVILLYFIVAPQRYETGRSVVPRDTSEYVILLHGLTRSRRSMLRIEKELTLAGYKVINMDYPATQKTIEYLAENNLKAAVEPYVQEADSKIHFVTHSIGGVVLRYYLKHHDLPNLGRVVMISPPNQGSEIVDHFKKAFLFERAAGSAGKQLGTDEDSLPQRLGAVDFELGVIAGNRSINPLYSILIPGPDDGVVSVERTKVEGMKDFIIMPHSHAFIIQSETVIDQVLHFLEHGLFKKRE